MSLTVYVDAMRHQGHRDFLRAPMWLEHIRRRGWQAVAAVEVTAAEQAGGRRHHGAALSAAELESNASLGVA